MCEVYDYLTSEKGMKIILSGWKKASGIENAVNES